MACAGGVDVLVGSLKPTIDEAMMTELIALCCQRRCDLCDLLTLLTHCLIQVYGSPNGK